MAYEYQIRHAVNPAAIQPGPLPPPAMLSSQPGTPPGAQVPVEFNMTPEMLRALAGPEVANLHGPSNDAASRGNLPVFMKYLTVLTDALPAVNIDARHTNFQTAILNNAAMKRELLRFSMLGASILCDLCDPIGFPRLKKFAQFIRNTLALNQLYHDIKSKFVIEGGSNKDDLLAGFKTIDIKDASNPMPKPFLPDDINDPAVCITPLNPFSAAAQELYSLQEVHRKSEWIAIKPNGGAGILNGSLLFAKSLYLYAPHIDMISGESKTEFALLPAGKYWYWLQVFEVRKARDGKVDMSKDNIVGYVYYFMNRMERENPSSPKIGQQMLAALYVSKNLVPYCMSTGITGIGNQINSQQGDSIAHAIYKKMRFRLFEPKRTSLLYVPAPVNPGDWTYRRSSSIRFMTRISTHCSPTDFHVITEYGAIRHSIEQCFKDKKSRGLAFVGYPGTGKTIMMNQLTWEFPNVPVLFFSVSSFMIEHTQPSFEFDEIIDSLAGAGFSQIFICCDDIDSAKLENKNALVERIISLIDGLRMRAKAMGISLIFMVTINDPTLIHSTIIKRAGRLDEVIEVPPPNAERIASIINRIKMESDPTDYANPVFNAAIGKMSESKFSLADITEAVSNISLYATPEEDGTFTPADLEASVERILTSRQNASKKFD